MSYGTLASASSTLHWPRHAAGDRMDRETDIDVLGAQHLRDLRDGVLRLGDGHAVADDDDDAFRARERLDRFFDRGLGDFSFHLVGAFCRRDGRDSAEEDVGERSVHGNAHDVRQDRAADADQ